MSKTTEELNFRRIHVLDDPDTGEIRLFERRRVRMIVDSHGHPRHVISDNATLDSWMSLVREGDDLVFAWRLVPIDTPNNP